MRFTVNLVIIICFLASEVTSNCSMEGVTIWQLPITVEIEDYHEGVFFERAIQNIQGYNVAYYDDLNGGPYVDISIANSMFVLRTNEAYRLYEENETKDMIDLAVTFSCTDGTNTVPLSIQIPINDNNNNDPLWKTENTGASLDTTFDFTIATPVAPGFPITDCVRDIIVRDIDLTTYRIDFGIEGNPNFEIVYDPSSSTVDKEFKASLRTTTFIRSIPEPIVLRISATDVDSTTDPPITTYTTLTIRGSPEFVLPEEPVFFQALYRATYNVNDQVTLEQPISLQQGYDAQVRFSLEGDYAEDHFEITFIGNQVSLSVTNPLPSGVIRLGQIHLVVKADREYTSGASSTVVVDLPEAVNLEFERPHYEGEIVENTLQLTQLILSQGYQESSLSVTVEDYPSFFTATIVGNIITLSMAPLDANIIEENNVINLRVTASTDYSSATTIVTLEIIKDDIGTPLFGMPLYTGSYDTTIGLTLEPLLLIQGYDDTVEVTFSGEHQNYFELVRDGPFSTLRVLGAGLPSHVLREQHLLLAVEVTKPRTVGASTVISIALPEAVNLKFERPHYEGEIVGNTLQLTQLILSQGYQESSLSVTVEDYPSFFTATIVGNIITLSMAPLDANIIEENNVISLRVTASTDYSSATTIVTLEIIKDDIGTPLFGMPLYTGSYDTTIGLTLDPLLLIQGYDDTVEVTFSGEHQNYFELVRDGPSLTLRVLGAGLPSHVLSQQHLLLTVEATKPRTVGASTVISIALPEAVNLKFERPHYEGEIVENTLQLTQLILSQGYQESSLSVIVEDYPSFFTATIVGNIITLSMAPLDANIIEENNVINLRVTASTDYSSATTIVTLEIIKDDIGTPLFGMPLYTGSYDTTIGLTLEPLLLIQGYDDTVEVTFSGEHQNYFELVRDGPSLTLRVLGAGLPSHVLSQQHLLLTVEATKPRTVGASTVISIALPEARELEFEAPTYSGSIQDNTLTLETIILNVGYDLDVTFSLSGDYASFFTISNVQNQVAITLWNQLPQEVISENNFLMFTVTAAGVNALPTTTAVLLEIIKADETTPVFSQAIYYGNYLGSLDIDIGNINLAQGFDSSISFRIEGENTEYFQVNQNEENGVTLTVRSAVPEEVIFREKAFVFTIHADKPLTVGANAAIFIKFSAELTEPALLQFAKNTYTGSLENNILTLENIVLQTGFATGTEFQLTGDYSSYFTSTVTNDIISLSLTSELSAEVLENNRFLVLELEASRERAVPVSASIIIELVKEVTIIPVFRQAFYTGVYTEENNLQFEETITLLQGYDETVTFALVGESSAWFAVIQNGNSLTLVSESDVPQDVLDSNHQLLFTVVASKPNAINGETAISIDLPKDLTDAAVLGFEQASYLGTIDNNVATIEPIVLTEGYTPAVTFALHGDLSNFFNLVQQGSSVTIVLQTPIPEQSLPANRILIFELRATAPDTIPAVATVVFNVVQEEVVVVEELVFSAPYYTGQFSEAGGLVFETAITLDEGYDENVQFALEGEHAQWFTLVVQGNSVTLATSGAIPPAVLANNQQLVFVVTAQKINSNTARATIVISLVDDFTDAAVLGFEQASYLGTIDNNVATIEPIVLTEGYTPAVTFALHGDLSNYFNLVQQGSSVTIVLQTPIPEQSLPANRILIFELRATAPDTIPAVATVVFNVVQEEVVVVEELVFSAPYYTGQFSEAGGLVFETAITLDEGYDEYVQFALEGEHAQWFTLVVQGNSVTLATSGAIPPAVLANNQQLVFVVTAQKINSNTARATIVISLVDDFTDAAVLGFEQASYLGTIDNNVATIEPIVLTEGYTPAVTFALHGDLSNYFNLVQQGSSVTIVLQTPIPEQSLPANRILIFELRAYAPDTIPAVATVVFNVVQEEVVVVEELVFSAPYYTGQFSEAGGLVFETAITLDEGYDEYVQFALEGEHAQWFTLVVQGNSVTLATSGAIPPAVLANNQQLVFVVTAQKINSNTARATIVISLVDDLTDAAVLGFEQASYLGTIDNNVATIEPIVLTEGYTPAVTFALHGDLSNYFNLVQQGSSVTIVLQTPIPEQSLPANRILIFELRATAPDTIPAVATVVFNVVQEEIVVVEELVFSAPYYTGQFSEAGGLVFETAITLDEGYDEYVQFALEGEHAQWFTLVVQGNSVTLATSGAIPPAVLANNQQLVFVVTAQKINSNTARATIVISLVDDFTDAAVLGFEQASYLGTIDNNVATIEPIVLTEGYTPAVTFALHGDLSNYFNLVQQGSSVTIVLQTPIPEQSLPANRILIFELRAYAPDTIPAVATVVFNVVQEEVVVVEELVFSAPYYTGQFSEAGGLVFETAITLDEGYDEYVQFALEGEHAQWFTLVVQGNSVTLATSGAIPPAVLANNQQLVFVVTAQKINSNTARATIVISLVDDLTDAAVLGFEQASYLGTIDNNVATIEPIVLTEGYTPAVTFALHGDLSNYFNLVQQGSSVTIVLQTPIPEQSLPANRILIFELRATAPDTIPAVATVVFNVVQEEVVVVEELVFSAPYYTGQFSEAGGLVFETAITLDEGYDEYVQFALEGEHAQWFTLVVQGNSVTLATSGAIPPAVLANNQQLVFVVTAQKINSNTARATIVISLVDDFTDAAVLGFEQASYLGTIDNNVATIEPIVLTEGYTPAVTFALHGDLSNYFNLVQQGSSVTIVLQTPIPEQSLPANRILIFELRAYAPDTIPAVATVVFNVVQEEVVVVEELVFSAPYYTGQFSEAGGLVFETAITLDEGYDEYVQFALEGEHAQWFTLVVQGNSVTLATSGAIPPAVLANNQQLVFVVTAQKINSNTARATIVISLVDDLTDAAVLGFEQASYLGTIDNNVATIEPIVLTEGYTPAVTFALHGDLSNYFNLVQQGSSVTIVLQTPIPEQSLPANRILIFELRAYAPDTIPAVATVVFNVVQEEVVVVEELVFSAPYYTGQFSEAGGLVFETAITLDEGYDEYVQFALEGEHAQWFTLVVQGNSVTLATSGAIPPAVLANNQQLVFVVTAQKINSNTARATIVISLVDDLTDAAVLGFEQASYLGTIDNNVATIEPIVLTEGYTPAVTFALHGDLSNYFNLVQQGSSVTIVLQTPIPEQSLPANRILIFELRATAPDTIPAVATVVFNVVQEEVVVVEELVFSAPYYTGQFSEAGGLVFETAITLDEGYDEYVQFALEGEHAQWFTLVVQGNSVTLATSGAIPPAVLANNQQLVFVVTAQKINSNTARATIVISLVDDLTDAAVLGFEQASYLGTIDNNVATIEPIVLTEGYTPAVTFALHGDLSNYFNLVQQGSSVTIVLQTPIPEQSLPANRILIFELRATAPDTIPAVATVVFNVVQEEVVVVEELIFSAPYYTGQFSEAGGLVFETAITLDEGYDEYVQFALEGEHAQWFTLVVQGNSVTLATSGAIPPAVLANNQQLVFVVTAQKINSNTARATIVISLVDDLTDAAVLGFEQASYLGTIDNNVATIEPIVLTEGYTPAVTFALHGDLSNYFNLVQQGSSVTIVLQTPIPEQSLPANRILIFELRAYAPDTIPAVATVVFNVVQEEVVVVEELVFSAPYYTGQFSEAGGLVFETAITLDEGYDEYVQFALEGEHAQWFTLVVQGNSVTLATSGAIPPAVLANNQQLVFVVTAQKINSNTARATIVISLVDDLTDAAVLGFEQASYLGTIDNNVATIEPIVLTEGYTAAVTFALHGDLSNYFNLVQQGSSVTIVLQTPIPEQSLPANRILIFELRATAPDTIPAVATVVFNVVQEEVVVVEELVFSAPYYTGQFSEAGGLVFETAITLDEGYDEYVQFALEGEHAQWFTLVVQGNSVTLATSGAIPPAVLANNQQLVFVVTAQKINSNTARATIVISLVDDSDSETEAFEKVLYEGIINLNVVQHETITITGYSGDSAEIFGDYRHLFAASVTEGTVVVEASGILALPEDVTHVPLELRAGAASAVLLLRVIDSGTPELPTVDFGSPSYVMRADTAQTGLIGRVSAVASNGEGIAYSLAISDAHLHERVSVTGEGEIHLSAPTNTGVYSFQVIATSIITQVQATAAIQLTVEATGTCKEDDHVLPPLIILDRDEEEPHENLVVLDSATHAGCTFRLTNRWPLEHDWLYVDENGLHARIIDREDPRIAFMALSQVQVELVLECASDTQTRARRSLNTNSRYDWLGPYDYGSNRWILTDTIGYNSRRSFVNLIVNDINDNYPIFIGNENEPIVVGYPIPELEDVVLPRALAELMATDADVGENAHLRYWSSEPVLAVAPATGSVHVRDGATLDDGALLTVSVTDLDGREDGLTTSIQLMVKLIDVRHIAVVTVRNAFLDQEETILSNLTAAVGYEVKVLSSAVISDDTDTHSANARNKQEVTSGEGASLQLYVYGLIDREPVAVDQLSADISENVAAIDVTSTISLEDHLVGREIPGSGGRDTGLLVATIVLSVLLFILIVAIAVWFFLRWRKARNYEQFSDANSLGSRNEPLEQPPKDDSLKKPRLNLEELKRSERRLQEMLVAPTEDTAIKPSTSALDPDGAFDTIINMAPPDTAMPIVIQSIDRLKDNAHSEDEDEYGERQNKSRRKSVVTFNENVEKIIHVEDIPDDNSSNVEVFRF